MNKKHHQQHPLLETSHMQEGGGCPLSQGDVTGPICAGAYPWRLNTLMKDKHTLLTLHDCWSTARGAA